MWDRAVCKISYLLFFQVRPYSPADRAGLKSLDFIWTINGKEVFEMSHKQCEDLVRSSGNTLELSTERSGRLRENISRYVCINVFVLRKNLQFTKFFYVFGLLLICLQYV